MEKCGECPNGQYATATQSTSCIDCPAGYSANSCDGNAYCSGCPQNQYSSAAAATICSNCPAGWSNDNNSSTACTQHVSDDSDLPGWAIGLIVIGAVLVLLFGLRCLQKQSIVLNMKQFGEFEKLGSGNFGVTYTASFRRHKCCGFVAGGKMTAVIKVPKKGEGDMQEMMACLRIKGHANISYVSSCVCIRVSDLLKSSIICALMMLYFFYSHHV